MADFGDFDGEGLGEPLGSAPSPDELCKFDLNDFGNAMRLIRLAGGTFDDYERADLSAATLLYLPEHGWIGFDGRRWDLKHGERLAHRLAHRVAQGLWEQARVDGELKAERWRRQAESSGDAAEIEKAKKAKPDKLAADFYSFAEQSGNAGRTSSMLKQAQAYLAADLDDFDRDPLAFAVENGTLKWRRGAEGWALRFEPGHRPADRITRMAPVVYDPTAKAPLLTEKLAEWLPDEPVRSFVQRIMGYASTGHTREQAFFIFQGKGGDGKSTLVDAVRSALGDYAVSADVKTFLDAGTRSGADANPDLARLAGDTRFVSTAEPPRGSKLNEAMIKSFTGGAPILARRLRQDPFEFTPKGKVILECNSRPVIRGDDEGIWRRLFLVMWEVRVDRDKMDRELPTKLRAERAGILNWLLDGMRDWLDGGLRPPPRVAQAIDDYRKGSSPFGEWLAEKVVIEPGTETIASAFYASFKDWLTENDPEAKPMSQRAFGQALSERQIIRTRTNGDGKVLRQGARLKTVEELHEDRVAHAQGEASPGGSSPSAPPALPPGGTVFDADDGDAFESR